MSVILSWCLVITTSCLPIILACVLPSDLIFVTYIYVKLKATYKRASCSAYSMYSGLLCDCVCCCYVWVGGCSVCSA